MKVETAVCASCQGTRKCSKCSGTGSRHSNLGTERGFREDPE